MNDLLERSGMLDRKNCPLRHQNGNCLAIGGFCTAVCGEICYGLLNAYDHGKNDALELLKAQEPVEPILALNDGEHELWQCGNCKVAVFTRGTEYCHNCGKIVKWDDCYELVVRCKDCKHQDPDRFDDGEGNYVCRKGHGWKPDNWFCADGERKEGR